MSLSKLLDCNPNYEQLLAFEELRVRQGTLQKAYHEALKVKIHTEADDEDFNDPYISNDEVLEESDDEIEEEGDGEGTKKRKANEVERPKKKSKLLDAPAICKGTHEMEVKMSKTADYRNKRKVENIDKKLSDVGTIPKVIQTLTHLYHILCLFNLLHLLSDRSAAN